MRKTIIAGTLAAASIAGLGAGITLALPGISNAQTIVRADSSTTTAADGTTTAPATAPAAAPDRSKIVSDALAKLVTDGTITQAQSDAVAKALTDALPAGRMGGGMHRGGGIGRGADISVVAKALGMTDADLRTALQGGKTIAQVAADKGVAVDTITAALKADLQTRLAAAVTAGKLTQAQADQMLTDADTHIAAMINGTEGPGFGGKGGPGMGRHGRPNDNDADDGTTAPAAGSSGTTSTTTA